jgi:hypothetical protein
MNQLDTENKSASDLAVSNSANTRLTGSWLIITRTLWLVLVVPSIGLFVVCVPVYYQRL